MTPDADRRAAILKWIDAYIAIKKDKKTVKCPICGLGSLHIENVPGGAHEVRIFCDQNSTHEVYLLNPDLNLN